MRGKLALLTGLAAGYVLGTKAGTERYEEIRAQFNKLMGTEPAQQLQTQVRDVASRASEVVEQKTTEGITKAGDKAQELVDTAASKGSSSGSSGTSGTSGTPTDTAGTGTKGYAGSGGPASAAGSSSQSTAKADKASVGAPAGKSGTTKSGPDDKSVTLP